MNKPIKRSPSTPSPRRKSTPTSNLRDNVQPLTPYKKRTTVPSTTSTPTQKPKTTKRNK